MKSEENVKQNKRKLNAIDIVIMAIAACGIIAVIIFAFMMLKGGSGDTDGDIDTEDGSGISEYVIMVPKLNTQLYSITKGADRVVGCPSLQVGDSVYERESGKLIGEITSIKYEDHREPTDRYASNGALIYADYVGYVDLYITVEIPDDGEGNALSVNGYQIRVGAELEFRTYGFYADGSIVSLSRNVTADEEGSE